MPAPRVRTHSLTRPARVCACSLDPVASIHLCNVLHRFAAATCKDEALGPLRLALCKLAEQVAEDTFLGNAHTQRGKIDEVEAVAALAKEASERDEWLGPTCSMASADNTFASTPDALGARMAEPGVASLFPFETKLDSRGRLVTADGRLKLPGQHKMQVAMHVECVRAEVDRINTQLAAGTPVGQLAGLPPGLLAYLSAHHVTRLVAAPHCLYRVSQTDT